jgi:hypothetical protein
MFDRPQRVTVYSTVIREDQFVGSVNAALRMSEGLICRQCDCGLLNIGVTNLLAV